METHSFSLIVDGIPGTAEGFESFCNALYPHAPDSTPSVREISFDRNARTLRDAVTSAVESVHRADPSVTVVGVVLDDGQSIDSLLSVAAV